MYIYIYRFVYTCIYIHIHKTKKRTWINKNVDTCICETRNRRVWKIKAWWKKTMFQIFFFYVFAQFVHEHIHNFPKSICIDLWIKTTFSQSPSDMQTTKGKNWYHINIRRIIFTIEYVNIHIYTTRIHTNIHVSIHI
jgi:hypothetical protein